MIHRSRLTPLAPILLCLTVFLAACGSDSNSGLDQLPAAPSGVTATAGPGYTTVAWTDNSSNETGFAIYREDGGADGTLRGQAQVRIGEVGPDTEQYVDLDPPLDADVRYGVRSFNDHGESSSDTRTDPVAPETGVDLMVGTNDRPYDDGLGTVFIVYFMLPDTIMADEATTFEVVIEGPDGWRGDEAFEVAVPPDSFARTTGFNIYSESGADATAGTYELEVTVGGDVHSASATLSEPGFALGPPRDITVTERSSSAVTVAWDVPDGARTSIVSLWRAEYEELVGGYRITADTSVTFEDLTLDDGRYNVEVAPVNVDAAGYPVKVRPFGLSYDSHTFLIGGGVAAACSSPTQRVDVPDPALAQAVRDARGISDGDITCEDMALLAELQAEKAGIESLEGMQYAINLTELRVWDNAIADVSPLDDLDGLRILDLNRNRVSDLTPLEGLTELRALSVCCADDAIDDISVLAGMVHLDSLDIGGHGLDDSDVAVLENLASLRWVWAWDNAITDPEVFTGLSELVHLHLSANEIDDVTFVDDLPNLRHLFLDYNPLPQDLSPLFDQTHLVELGLQGLGLSDIGFLEDFVDLETLYLTDNDITDVSPLVANSGLGAGDGVWVDRNLLDLSDGSEARDDIDALLDRGVEVEYGDQRTP